MPEVAFDPSHDPDAVHEDAFEELHEIEKLSPCSTEVDEALIEVAKVGVGAASEDPPPPPPHEMSENMKIKNTYFLCINKKYTFKKVISNIFITRLFIDGAQRWNRTNNPMMESFCC